MVIVDTSVWVDYLRGLHTSEAVWLDEALGRQRLGLTDLILSEVLQGVPDEHKATRVLRDLSALEVFPTGGRDLAIEAAWRFRALRAQGRTVRKTIDCLIAAFCLRDGHGLLHNDRDFEPFEQEFGLEVIHP